MTDGRHRVDEVAVAQVAAQAVGRHLERRASVADPGELGGQRQLRHRPDERVPCHHRQFDRPFERSDGGGIAQRTERLGPGVGHPRAIRGRHGLCLVAVEASQRSHGVATEDLPEGGVHHRQRHAGEGRPRRGPPRATPPSGVRSHRGGRRRWRRRTAPRVPRRAVRGSGRSASRTGRRQRPRPIEVAPVGRRGGDHQPGASELRPSFGIPVEQRLAPRRRLGPERPVRGEVQRTADRRGEHGLVLARPAMRGAHLAHDRDRADDEHRLRRHRGCRDPPRPPPPPPSGHAADGCPMRSPTAAATWSRPPSRSRAGGTGRPVHRGRRRGATAPRGPPATIAHDA